jgi:hypothetical protein
MLSVLQIHHFSGNNIKTLLVASIGLFQAFVLRDQSLHTNVAGLQKMDKFFLKISFLPLKKIEFFFEFFFPDFLVKDQIEDTPVDGREAPSAMFP